MTICLPAVQRYSGAEKGDLQPVFVLMTIAAPLRSCDQIIITDLMIISLNNGSFSPNSGHKPVVLTSAQEAICVKSKQLNRNRVL